ncbi:hypothetical protein O9992_21100 [Vibrio lentus]|nr:hypothetical protein [Vibrio lentus]
MGKVIEVIQSINLNNEQLALNAAIEVSKGERPCFAVVADSSNAGGTYPRFNQQDPAVSSKRSRCLSSTPNIA